MGRLRIRDDASPLAPSLRTRSRTPAGTPEPHKSTTSCGPKPVRSHLRSATRTCNFGDGASPEAERPCGARADLPEVATYYDASTRLSRRVEIWHRVYNHIMPDAGPLRNGFADLPCGLFWLARCGRMGRCCCNFPGCLWSLFGNAHRRLAYYCTGFLYNKCMATETTYTSLRENLASILDQVVDQQETVIVRRRGSRDVALVPARELAGLMETAHLLRSPENARRLLAALNRATQGKGKPANINELRREILGGKGE